MVAAFAAGRRLCCLKQGFVTSLVDLKRETSRTKTVARQIPFNKTGKRFAVMASSPQERLAEIAKFNFGPWTIDNSEVFVSTDLSFGFVNIRPLVPGHVLVSPIRTAARFSDLSSDEVSDLWQLAHRIGSKVEHHYSAHSLTFAIQDGPASGQTVPHVHIHILPRRFGDFERNDEVYEAIEGNEKCMEEARRSPEKLDLDRERTNRSKSEMAEEAAALAALF